MSCARCSGCDSEALGKIAAAFKSTFPSPEDHKDASLAELETMRRQWGICLGGTCEALESAGLLHDRTAFYRAAGLAVYD